MAEDKYLLDFIKKIAAEQNYEDYDLKITPVSSGGANYTSKLYKIKITAKGKDALNLFAKVGTMGEKMRNQTPLTPFDSERLVYTHLVKAFRHLEEKHGVSKKDSFKIPKYYGSDVTYLHEIFVMEDLTCKGFGSANRFEPVDWQYAAAALTELAKFHALSIAYQHEYPSEWDKILSAFPTGLVSENEDSDKFYSKSVQSALTAVREENKDRLKIFLESKNMILYSDMFEALRQKVLIHVDFRPNNMLHRTEDDGTTEVITVDYQTVQGGSPVIDLLYFIFSATDGQFRARHYQQLVDHYHSELGAALARFGVDVEDKYPRKDLDFELKEKLSYALLVSVLLLPILLVPEDQAPALDDTLNMASYCVEGVSELYTQRLNEAVDNFVEWGVI